MIISSILGMDDRIQVIKYFLPSIEVGFYLSFRMILQTYDYEVRSLHAQAHFW